MGCNFSNIEKIATLDRDRGFGERLLALAAEFDEWESSQLLERARAEA